MASIDRRAKILAEAWLGDAVLALYVRSLILSASGKPDSAEFERLTSNRALAVFGDPSEVEAAIGRVYESEGLAAAFAWIEANLMPRFHQQKENRKKAMGLQSPRNSVRPAS